MKTYTLYASALAMFLTFTGCCCQSDVCGRAPLNTKIVGGQNATAGSWPWQVQIQGFTPFSATLINAEWVLTVAHMVDGLTPSELTVFLGSFSRTIPNPHEIARNVSQIITHPNFSNVYNDIALLRLSSPVTFSDYISPVCLAAAGSIFVSGTESWIAGWGMTNYTTEAVPKVLQEAEIPILDNIECNVVYKGLVHNTMMCTAPGGEGPCVLDDGSALVINQDSQWIQAGIYVASGCGVSHAPAFYTRVSDYEDWINSHIISVQPGFVIYPYNDFILQPNANRVSSWTLHPSFIILTLLLCGLFS